MRRVEVAFLVIAAMVLLDVGLARGAVPLAIDYQGLALDPSGSPIDGTETVLLRIYDDPTSTAAPNLLYDEVHVAVSFVDGVFSVTIGDADFFNGTFDENLFSGVDVWLEIEIAGEILTPRTKLTSVAFALQCGNAATVNGIDGSLLLTGVSAGAGLAASGGAPSPTLSVDFASTQARVSGVCGSGEGIRQINADGTVVCEPGANAATLCGPGEFLNGDGACQALVTAVAFPLQVIVSTVSIAPNSIGSNDLAANSVGASEIAANAVGSSEIGTGAVGSSEIANGSVAGVDIANGAVGSLAIGNNSVLSIDIATSAVGSSEIASDAVRRSELDGAEVGIYTRATACGGGEELILASTCQSQVCSGVPLLFSSCSGSCSSAIPQTCSNVLRGYLLSPFIAP